MAARVSDICLAECSGQSRDGETEERQGDNRVEARTQPSTRATDTYLRLVSNPPVRKKRAVGPTAPFPHIGVPVPQPGIEKLAINTIRTLSMDAVQKAHSGHPGAPMALAPVAYELWQQELRYDPADPIWPNRDRFVLSNGHASMLLYALLHLTGVKRVDREARVMDAPAVSLDDIKKFRQLGSRTPGHPEYRSTTGVETTTGPLGQGVANCVGMAIAAAGSAAHFNRPGFDLFDYDVYAICGDGDMMEGVASRGRVARRPPEAAQPLLDLRQQPHLHRRQHRLAFTEDVAEAVRGATAGACSASTDANDLDALAKALQIFKQQGQAHADRRRLATSATGARRSRTPAPRTASRWARRRSARAKKAYGWPEDAQFLVPDGVREHFQQGIGTRGRKLRQDWEAHSRALPEGAARSWRRSWSACERRELPARLGHGAAGVPRRCEGHGHARVRRAGAERAGEELSRGCSAARRTSTLHEDVTFKGEPTTSPRANYGGRNIHFGVREHAMGSIVNGMALSQAARLTAPRFLIFTDYVRAADPARRADGDPGASTSSPTTPSAWARTGRRTSRSSSSPRCGRCPGSGDPAR